MIYLACASGTGRNYYLDMIIDIKTDLPQQLQESWYGAISKRRSYRSYKNQPIELEKLDSLTKICEEFSKVEARAALYAKGTEGLFKGIIGSYGKISGAPAFAAFIGNPDYPNFLETTGYIGECVVLEAVSIGLSTCWVAGYFHPETVADRVGLKPGEQAVAVSAIGYPAETPSRDERLIKKITRSGTRKDLMELTSGLPPEEWPSWVRTALEAARLAPSAVNRQPWRFHVEEDGIIISLNDLKDTYTIPKRLDCGIAMLHLELGARHAGVEGYWEFLDLPQIARFTSG